MFEFDYFYFIIYNYKFNKNMDYYSDYDKVNNNVIKIQRFIKNKYNNKIINNIIKIQRFIRKYKPNDNYKNDKEFKRNFVRKYETEDIKPLIKLAIKKVPKKNDILIENLQMLLNEKTKNENYIINQYVKLLTPEQIKYVGW